MGLGTSPQSESVLSLLHFGWGKWVIYINVLDKMGAAAEWTEPRGTLRSRLRATLSRPPGAPLPVLLPRNILKRLRRRRGGHSTRYLSRGARWTIACDAQKRGLLAHLRFINWEQAQDLLVDLYTIKINKKWKTL